VVTVAVTGCFGSGCGLTNSSPCLATQGKAVAHDLGLCRLPSCHKHSRSKTVSKEGVKCVNLASRCKEHNTGAT
jgi:hypothetical protein